MWVYILAPLTGGILAGFWQNVNENAIMALKASAKQIDPFR